jgi:hypothetical protein
MRTQHNLDRQCREYMAGQGITSKEKLQHRLQEIFEKAEHQDSALVMVYQLLFPDWDRIKQIEGFPVVGQGMWCYICNLFIDFDQQHHPGIFKGGLWFNNGFSSSGELEPWEISFQGCNVIYK